MFLTCDNGLISAIFLRNLCVQNPKPVRSLRNLCVTIDQCVCVSRSKKLVIITNLDKDKNQHKMLKIQHIFPKLYRCRLYVVFHNLESQNAELVYVKKDLHQKKIKGNFCARKSKK